MENLYEICNGSLMSKFIGSKVSVIGLVSKVNPNGVSFEMRTTDDMVIKVNCREPISHPLEGYVEVHGTAQHQTIICENIIQFPPEHTEDFDVISHNSYCKLLHVVPDLYRTTSN